MTGIRRYPYFLVLAFCLFLAAGQAAAATLVDDDGKALNFSRPFRRIISLYSAHTRNLLDLGLTGEIIAVGRGDEHLPTLPRVDFKDDPERLLALSPDLVLIRPMISRGYPALVQRLEQSGVRVVSLQPDRADDLFSYWEKLGRLTGRQEQAQAMILQFTLGLAAIRGQVEAIPPEKRKKVYFEAIHRLMKTFAPGSMAIFVLESAGGINAAADASQLRNTNIAEYGSERILARAGEIDVFLAQEGRMNPVSREEIMAEPGFAAIKAVRDGQVFLVDEELVSRPTMDLLAGIRKIHAILYPASTPGIHGQ